MSPVHGLAVLVGALIFLIVTSVAVEERRRADEAFAPAPVAVPFALPHHAMPLTADLLSTYRRRVLNAVAPLAVLIDNATAPMRGIA